MRFAMMLFPVCECAYLREDLKLNTATTTRTREEALPHSPISWVLDDELD